MAQKSLPAEVIQQVAQIPKDVAMELIEQGTGGLVKKQTTNNPQQQTTPDDQFKKKIEELQQRDKDLVNKEVPNLQWMLKQQEEQKQILEEEKEEDKEDEIKKIREKQAKKMEEQTSSADALAATGSHKSQPDLFNRQTEKITKQGM
ncbi:MAG: hypothetical protein NUV98_05885 [Candidatus Roizmanbacteria bacterium]|nr:hypothetical protein [Candidatus Roizmanbacteria bacterium]